jgi:hypothetical protein
MGTLDKPHVMINARSDSGDPPYTTRILSDILVLIVGLDLRTEPIVLCVPKIEKTRYCDVQLVDMYTFNYGYIGSRATGNDAGCFMIAGPNWNGDTPAGIKKALHSETQFGLVGSGAVRVPWSSPSA